MVYVGQRQYTFKMISRAKYNDTAGRIWSLGLEFDTCCCGYDETESLSDSLPES